MERVNNNFDFSILEKTMFNLYAVHDSTALKRIKDELNKFFPMSKCENVVYTNNTDKLFFGMKVFINIDGNDAINLLGSDKDQIAKSYTVEIDSKLLDPMIYLSGAELTALLIHEIGHIAYDTDPINTVRAQVDMYFADTDNHIDIKSSKGFKELLAFGIKDAVMKYGSVFSKQFKYHEFVADQFVAGCGYGPQLASAMAKIVKSLPYMAQDIDNRFIALSWVLRMGAEFSIRRRPAIKMLLKAKELCSSKIEKQDITYAINTINKMSDPVSESFMDEYINNEIPETYSKEYKELSSYATMNSINSNIYDLNTRLATATDMEDVLYVIHSANKTISILNSIINDGIKPEEINLYTEYRQALYDIIQKAVENKELNDRDFHRYIPSVYYQFDY